MAASTYIRTVQSDPRPVARLQALTGAHLAPWKTNKEMAIIEG